MRVTHFLTEVAQLSGVEENGVWGGGKQRRLAYVYAGYKNSSLSLSTCHAPHCGYNPDLLKSMGALLLQFLGDRAHTVVATDMQPNVSALHLHEIFKMRKEHMQTKS